MRRAGPAAARGRAGFSLIELVTVMAVAGVLTVGLAQLLQHPFGGYVAVSRRAELVALADLALARMARDLRLALPNSVRVAGGGEALELLHSVDGARYRLEPGINDPGGPGEEDHTAASDWLSFGGDTRWNVMGRLGGFAFVHGSPLPAGTRIAIYPTGPGIWAQAASGASPASITPEATSITIVDDGDEDQIQLDASHRFLLESPSLRLYVVDTPVSYLCDPGARTLWRIDAYPVASSQPTNLALSPLSGGRSARTAERVESCRFDYLPGTPTRSGLVTLEVVLATGDERVRLLRQVQVPNAP